MTAVKYFKENFDFAKQMVLFEELVRESIQEGDPKEEALRFEVGIKVESLDKHEKVIERNGRLITGRLHRIVEDDEEEVPLVNEGQDESIS